MFSCLGLLSCIELYIILCCLVLFVNMLAKRLAGKTNVMISFTSNSFPYNDQLEKLFIENGRYGHARYDPIRVFEYTQRPIPMIPIRVLRALVSKPLVILDQAGRLENAAYMQWVAHADH